VARVAAPSILAFMGHLFNGNGREWMAVKTEISAAKVTGRGVKTR